MPLPYQEAAPVVHVAEAAILVLGFGGWSILRIKCGASRHWLCKAAAVVVALIVTLGLVIPFTLVHFFIDRFGPEITLATFPLTLLVAPLTFAAVYAVLRSDLRCW